MAENHVTVIFDRKKKASENGIGKIELQIRLTRTCRKYITVDECTIQEWKARKISKNVIAEQNRIEKIVSAMECLGEDMTMENLNKHLGLETIKRAPRPKAIIKVKQEMNQLKDSFLDFMRDEIIQEHSKDSTLDDTKRAFLNCSICLKIQEGVSTQEIPLAKRLLILS